MYCLKCEVHHSDNNFKYCPLCGNQTYIGDKEMAIKQFLDTPLNFTGIISSTNHPQFKSKESLIKFKDNYVEKFPFDKIIDYIDIIKINKTTTILNLIDELYQCREFELILYDNYEFILPNPEGANNYNIKLTQSAKCLKNQNKINTIVNNMSIDLYFIDDNFYTWEELKNDILKPEIDILKLNKDMFIKRQNVGGIKLFYLENEYSMLKFRNFRELIKDFAGGNEKINNSLTIEDLFKLFGFDLKLTTK